MNQIKRIFAITICCFVFCNTQLFALIKSPPEKAILPNGLRVIVAEDKSLPIAAVALVFDTQVTSHENCNSGLSRIWRSLLENAGFNRQTRYDFNAELEKMGIITDFGSSPEAFFIAAQGNADQIEKLFETINKLGFMLEPTNKDLAQAKEETLRYVRLTKKYPLSTNFLIRQAWLDLFPEYGAQCHGPIDEEKLNGIGMLQLETFRKEVFVPNNAVLVVVGGVAASDIFQKSMQVFGGHRASQQQKPTVVAKKSESKSRKRENIEFFNIDNAQVVIAFAAPNYSSPDMPVTMLWKTALNDINDSWLETTVSKDFPELKNLHATYMPAKETGLFVIGFSSQDPDINRPINFILSALANVFNESPKTEALQRIVKMQQLKELQRRETRLNRAYDLGLAELMSSYRVADGIVSAYSRVTPDDMKRVAKKMFSSNCYSVRIAYPLKKQKPENHSVDIKVLENGTKIMVRNFSGSEIVGLSLLLGIDACTTNNLDKKMSIMVAEMVSAFINDRENREFNRQLDNIGATLNAKFSGDTLWINAKVQKQNLPELAVLLCDMIKFPGYSECFFKKSKEKLMQKIQNDKQSPLIALNRKLFRLLFPGMDIIGMQLTTEDLEKISFKDIQTFYQNWAVGRNLYISAVGNFYPAKAMEILAKAFREIPTGKQPVHTQCPEWIAQPLEKTIVEKLSLPGSFENAIIMVAFRMKPIFLIEKEEELRTHWGANQVIRHVLFSSSNSILAQELKKIGAYRGLNSVYQTHRTHAILAFSAEVPKEKFDEAKAVIEKVVASVPKLDFSKNDIIAAGKNLSSRYNRRLEKSENQALVLTELLYNGLKTDFFEEMLEIYSMITIDDVKKAASENFNNYLMLIGEPAKN